MVPEAIHGRRWLAAALAAAVLYAGHALFFDWSDAAVHAAVAVVAVVQAVRWPRGAAVGLLSLLALVFGLRLAAERSVLPRELVAGSRMSEARRLLAGRSHEFATLEDAMRADLGTSRPSPLRFSHDGPVAVFPRGQHAIWLLHDEGRVVGIFLGGS